MGARLFGGELAGLYHVGHEAVVAGELLQLSLMQQVGARIAHLSYNKTLAFQYGGGAGCSHSLATASFVHSPQHGQVGGSHGISQRVCIRVAGRLFGNGVHGNFGSHLSSGVSAHAICHNEQGGRYHQAVFVVVANAAHVGSAAERGRGKAAGRLATRMHGGARHENLTRMATSPTFTTSLFLSA